MDEYTGLIIAERVTAFFILAVIVHLLQKQNGIKGNYYLAIAAIFSLIGLIADSYTYQNERFGDLKVSLNLMYLIYFLSYTTYNGMLIAFILFCEDYIARRTAIGKWVFRIPIICAIVAFAWQLRTIFQGKLFYYDGTRMIYTSYYLPPFVLVLIILSVIYLPIVAFLKAKSIGPRAALQLTLYGLLPVIALGTGLINSDKLDYSPVASSMGIFLVYLFMQSDQEYEAVEKKSLLEKLLEERHAKEEYYALARFDSMTSVYRKAAFLDEAQHYLEKYPEAPVGLIFLDIDNFKGVNDTLGHPIGDQVIIKVAEIIRTSTANKDIIGRFGGDEFVIFMEDVSECVFMNKLEFLHKKLQLNYQNEAKQRHITCSIGAVYYQPYGGKISVHSLIKQADDCLYKAKEAGKDTYYSQQYISEGRVHNV